MTSNPSRPNFMWYFKSTSYIDLKGYQTYDLHAVRLLKSLHNGLAYNNSNNNETSANLHFICLESQFLDSVKDLTFGMKEEQMTAESRMGTLLTYIYIYKHNALSMVIETYRLLNALQNTQRGSDNPIIRV